MAEYVVEQVSAKDPKEWSFTDKKTGNQIAMKTYKVMVAHEEEPIDVNRKADSAKPVAGDVLDGTIEDTDFGKRFKATPKPFNGGAGTSYTPRDDAAIQAQWSIGQAVTVLISAGTGLATNMDMIESTAKDFFAMIDRVKGSKTTKEPDLTPPGDLKSNGSFKSEDF